MRRGILLLSLVFGIPTGLIQAQSDSPLRTSYTHQLDSDLDGGGSLATDSFNARVGFPIVNESGRLVALTARYNWTRFDFSGTQPGSFGALNPWSDVHALKFGLPVFWNLKNDWTLFALPSLSFSFEDGADIWESISGGTLLGASYQWTDSLAIGPGFGFFSQLEDDASLFPLIYLDWQVTDSLNLTTRPSGAVVSGPGLLLNWTISERWRASFGANYEKARFRIAGRSVASRNGVGEYRGIPVHAALTFQPGEHLRFSAFAGVRFANELRLENSRGATLIKHDSDPAPFFGTGLSLHF